MLELINTYSVIYKGNLTNFVTNWQFQAGQIPINNLKIYFKKDKYLYLLEIRYELLFIQ